MSACSICAVYFASSISPCLSFIRSPLNVCAHASLCLGCECAFEYLITFLSHSRVAELTTKLRWHNYLPSTADLLVKQLLRKLHRMRPLSSGQLCILCSCLLSLTREFRGRQLLGGAGGGQVTRRRGAVASQGQDSLCWEQRSVFCWGQRETMSYSRGKIDFSFHNHCCCLWFFFFQSFLYYFFSTSLQYVLNPS